MRFEQMAAHHLAVGFPEDGMHMQARSVIGDGDARRPLRGAEGGTERGLSETLLGPQGPYRVSYRLVEAPINIAA
jgi:hypothetical protein